MSLPICGTGRLMCNTCREEKGLQWRQAKMFHLLCDNYSIPSLRLLASAFDPKSLPTRHKITTDCAELRSPVLYFHIYLIKEIVFPFQLDFSPLSLCSAVLPLLFPSHLFCIDSSWHIRHWLLHDSDATGTGRVSHCQLHIFLKSTFARVSQRAPSLVNRTRI